MKELREMWEEAADCIPSMQQQLEAVQEQTWCLRQQAEVMHAAQAEQTHASAISRIAALEASVQVSKG